MYIFRCLDSSGGYLFHGPHRAGAIIETCVCLHNCAKAGKVKLLRDFPAKDNFHKIQEEIVQPDNLGRKERVVFQNLRKDFINEYFTPRQPPPDGPRAGPSQPRRGGPPDGPRAGPSQPRRGGPPARQAPSPRPSLRASLASGLGKCVTQ